MRHGLLCDELDDITHSYDYGIVPGSATVFVKDELNNIGRLDLTLLEGVMIVVEVSEEGYKVMGKKKCMNGVYIKHFVSLSGCFVFSIIQFWERYYHSTNRSKEFGNTVRDDG